MKKAVSLFLLLVLAVGIITSTPIAVNAAENVYSFTTIDNKTVYNYSSEYALTINVFGRDSCLNTRNMLQQIINLGYDTADDIKVNFIDCNADTKEGVSEFSDEYSGSSIDFCYDTTSAANNLLWYYARLVDESCSVSLPVVAFINSDGTIRKITTGAVSKTYLANIVNNGELLDESLSFSITGTDNYNYAYAVLDLLNETRSSLGLNELKMNAGLLDIAMQRAAEISIYFSHTRPDNSSCYSLATGYGSVGENIAIGQATPERVMSSWLNSTGHYNNIVNDSHNSVGIGCFKASNGVYCWVQFFSSETTDFEVLKSGSVNATHNIEALFCNLSLYSSPSAVSLPLAESGDKLKVSVDNVNVCYSYAVQTLDSSSFNYTSSDGSVISAGNNGEYTVKNKGNATLSVILKSNDKIKFSCPVVLGHNHSFTYYYSNNDATCLTDGTKTATCDQYGCDETKTVADVGSKLPHSSSAWIIDKKASCSESGSKHKECTICGIILETKAVDITDHTQSSWITDQKATVNSAGSKHKECTECGKVLENETIKQLKCSKPKASKISNTATGVKITWGKVSGADSYEVYRKVKGGSYNKVGTTSKTYFTDKTAKSGKTYYYVVKAVNEAGKSANSNTLSIKCLADPTLKALTSAKKGITLKWTKTTGAQGYVVYRKTGNGSFSKLATVKGVSNLSYLDKTAKKNEKYTYKVKAYYGKTYSAYSNTKTIKDKY